MALLLFLLLNIDTQSSPPPHPSIRYQEGMLQAKTGDSDTKSLVEGAAAGMVAAIESQGSEIVEEWEVDELLEWTSGLNFEEWVE